MDSSKYEIAAQLLQAFMPAIGIFISYLVLKLTKYVEVKTKDEDLKRAMNQINNIVDDVVKNVERMFVEKQKVSKNYLTPQEAGTAKGIAINLIRDHLGSSVDNTKRVLAVDDEQLDKIISTKIEAKLFDIKKLAPVMIFIIFLSACGGGLSMAKSIKNNELITSSIDEKVATWQLNKNEECIKQGVEVRNKSKKPTLEQQRKDGLDSYLNCIKSTKEISEKIGDKIAEIRKIDKQLAEDALLVIQGIKVTPKSTPIDALNLIKELSILVMEGGIK